MIAIALLCGKTVDICPWSDPGFRLSTITVDKSVDGHQVSRLTRRKLQ
jgi:hypothetical protein